MADEYVSMTQFREFRTLMDEREEHSKKLANKRYNSLRDDYRRLREEMQQTNSRSSDNKWLHDNKWLYLCFYVSIGIGTGITMGIILK